jgi:3-methyladenine DNA glycosylase AlkD
MDELVKDLRELADTIEKQHPLFVALTEAAVEVCRYVEAKGPTERIALFRLRDALKALEIPIGDEE